MASIYEKLFIMRQFCEFWMDLGIGKTICAVISFQFFFFKWNVRIKMKKKRKKEEKRLFLCNLMRRWDDGPWTWKRFQLKGAVYAYVFGHSFLQMRLGHWFYKCVLEMRFYNYFLQMRFRTYVFTYAFSTCVYKCVFENTFLQMRFY